MKASLLAVELDLAPSGRPGEWKGTHDGVTVGVHTSLALMAEVESAEIAFFVEHDVPLRLGMLAEERAIVDQLKAPIATIADVSTESGLGLQLRAADAATARAILRHRHTQDALQLGAPAGHITIDDHRAWLNRIDPVDPLGARALLAWLVDLSRALLAARSIWRAAFEPAIEASWRDVAASHDLAFDPVRSVVSGGRRGASIEARIDSEPGLLYTEIFLAWPSLGLGLHIEREAARGTRRAPSDDLDLDALERAFNDDHRVRARERRSLQDRGIPADVMRAALAIGALGASLSIDDTGLVARVDRVLDEHDEIDALVRSAIRIAIGLATPEAPRSAFR